MILSFSTVKIEILMFEHRTLKLIITIIGNFYKTVQKGLISLKEESEMICKRISLCIP